MLLNFEVLGLVLLKIYIHFIAEDMTLSMEGSSKNCEGTAYIENPINMIKK